jgi:hypothetical protein
MLRLVFVIMPGRAPVTLSVTELVMALAMEQGIRESDLRTALASELRNNALNP